MRVRAEQAKLEPEDRRGDAPIAVPAGAPEWITPELIRLTVKVWQPYYAELLTPDDAVTIVQNAGRLFGHLSRE